MVQKLPRLILFAALAMEGAVPARATPPKHPPLPKARPVFPDDPPPEPADPNAPQGADGGVTQYAPAASDGVSQPAAYQATAPDTSSAPVQYAAAPPVSYGPFGTLYAPAQPTPAPAPPQADAARPPVERAVAVQPPPAAGPADYPQPPVDLRAGQQEEVDGFAIAEKSGLADMTRRYARQHGIPLALLHRIIMRESKYCPRLVNRRYYGLMQITPATARSMGYKGSTKGLLDPETNLAYGAPYLANAWALADGDMDRAVRLYASGYYYTAKSKKMLGQMRNAHSAPANPPAETAVAAAPPPPPPPRNIFEAMFGSPNR